MRISDWSSDVCSSDLPDRINNRFLARFEEFRAFTDRGASSATEEANRIDVASDTAEATPDEIMRAEHRRIEAALAQDLLDRVRAAPPVFFARLIVNLLLAMGYGASVAEAGRALGRSEVHTSELRSLIRNS